MHRGKIIGAIVLVAALGLIIARLAGGPGGAGDGDRPAAAGTAAAQGAGDGGADDGGAGDGGAGGAVLPASGESRVYTIDPAASEVYWRIYRSGALARLGHSHVISMGELEGEVTLTSDLAAAEWQLRFPVDGLVVDDPELRARHGEEFESVPSEDDRAGTRDNMLSAELLDGAAFPLIRLEGTGVNGPLASAELPLTIGIVGNTIEASFPAAITITEDAVTVTGEYQLMHEDLGLTPFTALGGAMAVSDEIDFTYRIRAVAGGQ